VILHQVRVFRFQIEVKIPEELALNAMTGTYPDSNEDVTFWSDVKTLSRGDYYPEEEEMAVLIPDKQSSAHKTSPSSDKSTGGSQSSAIMKWESPRSRRRSSYNFNEVAINLQNTAERALEESTSTCGSRQNSICRGVARIVLEESNNVVESSKEYIAGVVRKVARFAQDAGHDEESSSAVANQVVQPEGTTSLGTMVSFFVIWCVSLCASHMDSKDMPAPALKLAAEEVASVLQSSRSPSRSGAAAL